MRAGTLIRVAAGVAALTFATTAGTSSATLSKPPVPGAERFGNGWAVPMSTKGPAWFDKAYYDKVIAAGTHGVALPPGASMPGSVGAVGLASTGIRPGTWLVSISADPFGEIGFAWCTANFVFTKNGTYGLGTAGHCAAKDAIGHYPDVTAYVVPPVGQGTPGFYHIGSFSLSHNNGIGDDFAMVSINSAYNTWMNPTMPVWGGPTGVYTSNAVTAVKHFGHGAGVGAGGTPRAGIAPIWTARGGNAFAWYGVGFEGDSGSAVNVVTGEGAGDFTHIVFLDGIPGEILPGMLAGTRLTKILSIANGWTLVPGSMIPTP